MSGGTEDDRKEREEGGEERRGGHTGRIMEDIPVHREMSIVFKLGDFLMISLNASSFRPVEKKESIKNIKM